jgi:hypothetical protein
MSTDQPTSSDFIPEATGAGNTVMPGDDLSTASKDTLAAYLSSLTTDSMQGNAIPIAPDNPRGEFSLVNPDGTPAEFVTGGQDNTQGFTDTFPTGTNASEAAVRKFETLSNSGKFDVGPGNLESFLNKNAQTDGNYILRDVASSNDNDDPGIGNTAGQTAFENADHATPMQRKISAVLRRHNRFDPMPESSPYIEENAFTEPGIPIEQGEFGVYDKNADRTTVADLQKVAYSMMMRASGHSMTGDPTSLGAMVESILPTFVQTGGMKVSTNKLRAQNSYHAPHRPEVENGDLLFNDLDGAPLLPRKSVGSLNNPYEKFEHALVPQVLTGVTALAEMAALGTIFGAIMLIIETAVATSTLPSPKSPHAMTKGQHLKVDGSSKVLQDLSVPIGLSKDFWECVCWGMIAFFQLPSGSGWNDDPPEIEMPSFPPTGALPAPLKIAAWFAGLLLPDPIPSFRKMQYSSGYYATMLRTIRIDMNQLLDNLIDFVPSSPDPDVILFNLVRGLNKYRSWRFYCTLAKLGDLRIKAKKRRFGQVKSIEKMPNNGQTRQGKSRAAGLNSSLAWRHRAMPSLILLPEKYANAYTLFGFESNYASNQMSKIGDKTNSSGQYWNDKGHGPDSKRRRKIVREASHRISQEDVAAVEDELDSEYCPFYFHDLRTNEVIAFQAFLESLSDSYSVSYAESAGYGRIDPVKIYQNTSRSISMSWMLVATSPDDFDSMWWSVNKLVSMCYPQFSMGKPIKAGTKKFVMPFSQIPTASPVIRLRVGDVIRSNYSRFNLARIFGISEAIPAATSAAGGTVPGTGATGGTSAENDAANAANLAAWAGAPFDLTYSDSQAASQQEQDDNDTSTYEAEKAAINDAVAEQPVSAEDPDAGYWPPSQAETTDMRGMAMLRANSSGYTSYDMDASESAPTDGSHPVSVWPSYFPPPTATSGLYIESTPFLSRFYAPALVRILARRVSDASGNFAGGEINTETDVNDELREGGVYAEYLVTLSDVDDAADPYGPVSAKEHTHAYVVTSADLDPVYPPMDHTVATTHVTLEQQVTDIFNFFNPNNNAIVRSFEAAGGKGLAGVITSFDMDWGEAMWDMSGIGRRAPQFIKCSISFSPIHDIVPGLDNNGAMRAYNYPVGGIAGGLAEDFYSRGAGRPAGTSGRKSAHVGTPLGVTDGNRETLEGWADSTHRAMNAGLAGPGSDGA